MCMTGFRAHEEALSPSTGAQKAFLSPVSTFFFVDFPWTWLSHPVSPKSPFSSSPWCQRCCTSVTRLLSPSQRWNEGAIFPGIPPDTSITKSYSTSSTITLNYRNTVIPETPWEAGTLCFPAFMYSAFSHLYDPSFADSSCVLLQVLLRCKSRFGLWWPETARQGTWDTAIF